jgi:hypothetical protein
MATRPDAVSYFDDTNSVFEDAFAQVDSPLDDFYRLADRTVRVRVAGPALAARFAPAFSYAACAPVAHPDLSIACWDRAATRTEPPPPMWSNDDYLPRGLIRGYVGDRVRAAYGGSERMLSLYDRDRGQAVVHVADATDVGSWADRAPFRTIIGWWADDRDLAFLHASAVARGERGLAFAGPSGAGKSTTALTGVLTGWRLLSDDICLVQLNSETQSAATLFPVFAFAKLEPDALLRLPELGRFTRDNGEQLIVDAAPVPGDHATLQALLLTKVGAGGTRLIPLSPAAALRLLVPSSVLEGIGAGTRSLPILVQLLERVPCLSLELGPDPADVTATLDTLSEQLS